MLKPIYNFFHRHYHLRYHNQYVHAKKLFVFDIFLLALAIGLFGAGLFFFFWRPGLTDWVDLKLSYGGGRLQSGGKTTLIIDYTNRSKYKLLDATLAIHLPPGFIVDSSLTPATEFSDQSTFSIKEIKPGAKGQKEIVGWMWVEPKKEERILAVLSYTPENSTNREQKLGEFLVNLPDSVLETTVDFNTKTAFPKASAPITVTIKNTSETMQKAISIYPHWAGVSTWNTKADHFYLQPGESKKISGSVLMFNKPGNFPFSITTEIEINKQRIIQNIFSTNIEIIYPETYVEAKIISDAKYAEPKMTLPIQISWRNNSAYELQNQRVRIGLTAGAVDLKSTARENNLKIENGELVLDSSNQTILANGRSGSGGKANINLILLPTFSVDEKENAYLEILPKFESSLNELSGQKFTNDGTGAKILLTTEASLSSEIRYFTVDGDQLGRGPLPPRVGETTKYWVFVRVGNTSNPLDNPSLNIVLAPGTKATGKQSVTLGSALVIQGDKISWTAPQIPANGTVGVYFEVETTPTAEQVGKKLKLVNSIQTNGVDAITGKSFILNREELYNILPLNDRGVGMGFLVE